MATQMLKALRLPPQTEVTAMTVVPEHTFLGGITLGVQGGVVRQGAHETREKKASELLGKPVSTLETDGLEVRSLVCTGNPAEEIVKRSHGMRSNLVVIGAKGAGDPERFPLGSVAQKVMKYADTSVLLAREKATAIRRVLLATDGSKHSDAAVQFLLDLPLPRKSQVFVVTVLHSHTAVWLKTPTLNLKTNRKLLEELQAREENTARSLLDSVKKKFRENKYNTESLTLKGEPAEEILMAAETLTPELIVLGAKGLTGIENFLLGSVAPKVARFSRYSVLIVRP